MPRRSPIAGDRTLVRRLTHGAVLAVLDRDLLLESELARVRGDRLLERRLVQARFALLTLRAKYGLPGGKKPCKP